MPIKWSISVSSGDDNKPEPPPAKPAQVGPQPVIQQVIQPVMMPQQQMMGGMPPQQMMGGMPQHGMRPGMPPQGFGQQQMHW